MGQLALVGGRLTREGHGFYCPIHRREDALFQAHDAPMAGHFGRDVTIQRLVGTVWWPGMKKDVANYVRLCSSCQRNKKRDGSTVEPAAWPIAACFQRCHMDLVGPLSDNPEGYRYLFTLVDSATKFIVARPIKDKTANTIVKTLIESVILNFGVPECIVSDNAKEFLSELNTELLSQLGITARHSAPFHPQGNGQIERQHLTLAMVLRSMIHPDQHNWPDMVPYACFAVNTARHRTIGTTPFFLMFGRKPRTILEETFRVPSEETTVSEWLVALKKARAVAASLDGVARNVDRTPQEPAFRVGDHVWVQFTQTRKGKSKKLMPVKQGPYTILEVINGVTAKLQHIEFKKDIIVRHFSFLEKVQGSLDDVAPEEHWEVDRIVDQKKVGKKILYLVHYRGFDDTHNEWKTEADLSSAADVLDEWRSKSAKDDRSYVYRVIEMKAGRTPRFLVATEEDVGPDDYVWVTKKDVQNPEVLDRFVLGGSVVGKNSHQHKSKK